MIVKIGAVAATSGPVGLLGRSFLKAVQLAFEDLRNTTHQYQLIIEELQSPDQAEPAIEKLVDLDAINALVIATSASSQIVKGYTGAAKIPLFCVASIGSVGDEVYTFTTMPLAEDEATQWVTEARRRGIKTVARLTQDYPSIDNHVRAVKAEASKAGIEFVFEDRFEATTTNFRSRIEAAKKAAPDVYYVEAFAAALDLLGQQLQDSGIHNIASVVAFSVSERPELFEGGWYTDSYVSPQFRAQLDRRFPGIRLATHMMPYAYDSVKMLAQAFESGPDVLTYIRGMTEYDGTAGKITKQAGTGNFRSAPAIWVIKDGKPTLPVQHPRPALASIHRLNRAALALATGKVPSELGRWQLARLPALSNRRVLYWDLTYLKALPGSFPAVT